MEEALTVRRSFARHGWLGLCLVAIFWALNWGLEGPRTQWGFSLCGWATAC